jgi:transposase
MQVYIGIDWSEQKHDVIFMNQAGSELAYMCIPHEMEGFLTFDAARRKLGLAVSECKVGLETSHNLLIDYLLSLGYPVYVLPPNQVRSNQGRFRQSGAKDDPADARIIADILRTDHQRLRPWQADALLTRQMRAKLYWLLDLNQQILQLSSRLRAILLRYYPAALAVFSSGLTAQIASEFIMAYPTPRHAKGLSLPDFVTFARKHRYPNHRALPTCYARLQAGYPETSPEVALIYQHQAVELAHLLVETIRTRVKNLAELQSLYRQHPKHAVFASLPATGELIGPGLLVHFGDDLERFPHPSHAQTLAGTAPVTQRSGKRRIVRFRWACDKHWRYICQEWAIHLVNRTHSPIALAYYHQIRPHCHSNQHAYRCIANRWLAVAWKLWRTDQLYDEAYHLNQRAVRSRPRDL